MEKNNNMTKNIELSIRMRGEILHHVTKLEKWIESSISSVFAENADMQTWLVVILLDRMTFDGKISAYEQIMKHKFQQDFKKKCQKLFSELRYIKDERNVFAHFMLSPKHSKENEDTGLIGLLNFRNSIETKEYSTEKINQIIQRVERCIIEIEKIDAEGQINDNPIQ